MEGNFCKLRIASPPSWPIVKSQKDLWLVTFFFCLLPFLFDIDLPEKKKMKEEVKELLPIA